MGRYRRRVVVAGSSEELSQFLDDELAAIEATIHAPDLIQLTPLAAAPDNPRDGMLVCADGANWNPGSGGGFYGYFGGAWRFLG